MRARDSEQALRKARQAIADGRPADAMLIIGRAVFALDEVDHVGRARLAALANIAVASVLQSRVLH